MQDLNRSNKIDNKISLFIVYSFLLVAINRVATLPFVNLYENIIARVQWIIYIVLFFSCVKYVFNRNKQLFSWSFIGFVLLYIFSCFLSFISGNPVDLLLSHDAVWTLCFFLPVGLSAAAIKDYEILYNKLYRYSYVISVCSSFYIIYRVFIAPFGNSYDMAVGYILLLPVLFHYTAYKKNHNFFVLIISIIETALLLLFASRGVLIGILSFYLLYSYFSAKNIHGKCKIVALFLCFSLVYFQLPLINDYLESQGLYSRTLHKLANGNEDRTYGRTRHWEVGLNLVADSPIIGYGLGGYYYEFHDLLAQKYPDELYSFDINEGIWVKSGVSASGTHSGFIEVLLLLGVLAGLPIACWILFSVLKIKYLENDYLATLLLIFYCSYIIGNMIVGEGIFTKPGCGIFIFLMLKYTGRTKVVIR